MARSGSQERSNAPALAAALGLVTRRHEILRTTLHRRAGMRVPYQVIHEEMSPSWEHVDLSGLPPTERAGRIEALIAEERGPPDRPRERPPIAGRPDDPGAPGSTCCR